MSARWRIPDLAELSAMSYGCETDRLLFIEQRDGIDGAIDFAARTRSIYRRSVLKNGKHGRQFHYASTRGYRRGFIESYLSFKRFLAIRAADGIKERV